MWQPRQKDAHSWSTGCCAGTSEANHPGHHTLPDHGRTRPPHSCNQVVAATAAAVGVFAGKAVIRRARVERTGCVQFRRPNSDLPTTRNEKARLCFKISGDGVCVLQTTYRENVVCNTWSSYIYDSRGLKIGFKRQNIAGFMSFIRMYLNS